MSDLGHNKLECNDDPSHKGRSLLGMLPIRKGLMVRAPTFC
jgi:hypothetical protein